MSYIVAGNGIYDHCNRCGKLIRLNKPIFGSMHVCVADDELAVILKRRAQVRAMLEAQAPTAGAEQDAIRRLLRLYPYTGTRQAKGD